MDTIYTTDFGTFEWDEDKNAGNIKKHGISFQLAVEVFNDPAARFFEDPDHSSGECRMTVFGSVGESFRIVRVTFTERGHIRIISARRAEKKEVRMLYA